MRGLPRAWRRFALAIALAAGVLPLSGCVAGYGRCLFLQSELTLTGTWVPAADGAGHARLVLDETAYVYAPALSQQCVAMQAAELVLPAGAQAPTEGARISVTGRVRVAASDEFRTRFAIDVTNLGESD